MTRGVMLSACGQLIAALLLTTCVAVVPYEGFGTHWHLAIPITSSLASTISFTSLLVDIIHRRTSLLAVVLIAYNVFAILLLPVVASPWTQG